MEQNEIVLSYKSNCLRRTDVKCFEDFNQLNDIAIGFYYEVLFHEKVYESLMDKVHLVQPASASLIVYDYDIYDLIEMFEPMKFDEKEIIFFPLNDNTDKYNYGAGNHWTLLIYQKCDDMFYYLDSMGSYIKNTEKFATQFVSIKNSKKENKMSKNPKIINLFSEKLQTNSYDCGMFVLAFTKSVLNYLLKNEKINAFDIREYIFSEVSQVKLKQLRKEISQLLSNLKKNVF
jgi:Ulp1 family protease